MGKLDRDLKNIGLCDAVDGSVRINMNHVKVEQLIAARLDFALRSPKGEITISHSDMNNILKLSKSMGNVEFFEKVKSVFLKEVEPCTKFLIGLLSVLTLCVENMDKDRKYFEIATIILKYKEIYNVIGIIRLHEVIKNLPATGYEGYEEDLDALWDSISDYAITEFTARKGHRKDLPKKD